MVDLRTLLLLVAVADLMVAVVLWMGAGRRLRQGMGAWIASLFARCAAVAVLGLAFAPQSGAFALAAALLALSMTLAKRAMESMMGAKRAIAPARRASP